MYRQRSVDIVNHYYYTFLRTTIPKMHYSSSILPTIPKMNCSSSVQPPCLLITILGKVELRAVENVDPKPGEVADHAIPLMV